MTEARSPSKRQETLLSLKAQLEFLAGDSPALFRLIRGNYPLTVENYLAANLITEDQASEDEMEVVEVLRAYEKAITS